MAHDTPMAKAGQVDRAWVVIDATDKILGRLATEVATILRGKDKPIYTPHVDVGDHVIIVNAEKVRLTGRKAQQKVYYHHTGYPGGIRETPFLRMLDKHPERVIEMAVRGMLPKNRLGRQMFRKLKVYRGAEHPHEAQMPTVREI